MPSGDTLTAFPAHSPNQLLKSVCVCVCVCVCVYVCMGVYVVLGFELGISHLLDRNLSLQPTTEFLVKLSVNLSKK
jgi:hypothetical protein